jgi:hypothetical protein
MHLPEPIVGYFGSNNYKNGTYILELWIWGFYTGWYPFQYFDIIWILKVMGYILALIRVPSTIKLTYLKYC